MGYWCDISICILPMYVVLGGGMDRARRIHDLVHVTSQARLSPRVRKKVSSSRSFVPRLTGRGL